MRWLGAFLLAIAGAAGAQELQFATPAEARGVLTARDEFVARMSPFDRSARLKVERDVTVEQYLEFAAAANLEWTADEQARLRAAFAALKPSITRLGLPLPARVTLVKTSGLEEGNAAYTRGRAIMLPASMLSAPDAKLSHLLAHELFHVATREKPAMAKAVYAAIGFTPCGELRLTGELEARRITNPDAPRNDYCIDLSAKGERFVAIPILLSSQARYDAARGGEFFQYLQLRFLWVTKGASAPVPVQGDGGPRMSTLAEVSGYFEQVGRNTDYIIHPEEILAENFALLATGATGSKSPEVLARVERALAATAR